jgi:hypothetical protein
MTVRNRIALFVAIALIAGGGLAGSGRAEGPFPWTVDRAVQFGGAAIVPAVVDVAIAATHPDDGAPVVAGVVGATDTGMAKLGAANVVGALIANERSLGERALDTVRVLAEDIGIRAAGTPNERRAAAYLADEYRALGYEVTVPTFAITSTSSRSGESQNVEARFPNEDPTARLVIIGAHYDSVPAGPGANDNGSGTATILEVAREFAANPPRGVAIRFISFGAEEIGLVGSRAYVAGMSQQDRQRTVLMMSVDMMAVGDNPAFGGTPEWVFQAMARAESQGYRPINQSDRLRRMSDHAPFMEAGMPALMFHWYDDPFYHTVADVVANLKPAAMDLMGAIVIDLVRVAAN